MVASQVFQFFSGEKSFVFENRWLVVAVVAVVAVVVVVVIVVVVVVVVESMNLSKLS